MFSLDDDSFELNEEDFLQAAIDIEKKVSSPPFQNSELTLPVRKNEAELADGSTNTSWRNQPSKNGEMHSPGIGSLFNLGGEGDDSVFDLSLDSPVKWNAAPQRNAPLERPEISLRFGTVAQPPHHAQLSERVFAETEPPKAHHSSPLDEVPEREIAKKLPSTKHSISNTPEQPNQHAFAFHKPSNSSQPVSSDIASPVPGTSSMIGSKFSEGKQSSICDSPLSDAGNSPTFFSTPKGVRTKQKRKFPGPAGLLPKLKPGESLAELTSDAVIPEVIGKKPITVEDLPSSQCAEDHFQYGLWPQMLKELEPQARNLMKQYPVNSINRKAHKKQLPSGKVPVLGVVIESINFKNSDASVSLKDPSGCIRGTLHRELVKEYGNILQPGCVLVLRQIGVFNPLSRNHYLNITPSNVVRIYTNSIEGSANPVKVSDFSPEDFVISVNKPASPSIDLSRINLRNSPVSINSPQLAGSVSAGTWNTIGRGGVSQGTPRPSMSVRSPLVRPNQPPRFIRTPNASIPTTPRSTFVRHTYGTPSVASPLVGTSQRNPGVMNSSNTPVGVQRPSSNAIRPPENLASGGIRPQNFQNMNTSTPRLRTPNIPAVATGQAVCNPTFRTPNLSANNLSQNVRMSTVSNPGTQTVHSQQNSSTCGLNPATQNAKLPTVSANTFKTPRNPDIQTFRPPLVTNSVAQMDSQPHGAVISSQGNKAGVISNSSNISSQPTSNINRTPFTNVAQSPVVHPNTSHVRNDSTIYSGAIGEQNPKPHTPGKFTFKRKAVTAPTIDFAKKQQMSAPSSFSDLQNTDPHGDLLAGLEHELLDDDF